MIENALLDAKAQQRAQALTAWAADAAGRGHAVPVESDLIAIAVGRTVDIATPDRSLVDAWSATLKWILSQAAFGVVDPHVHLPEELSAPVGRVSMAVVAEVVPDPAAEPEAVVVVPPTAKKAPAEPAADKSSARAKGTKWEADAREQVESAVRRFAKPLADLLARDANEGDTRLLITDMLCEGLGYDKFRDLTTEYMVRQDFADYGVRIDKQLVAFIEVKRVSQKLNERHLRQVQMYAVNEGVEWMILTNGVVWQAYHLTGGLPVLVNLAFEINLLGAESVQEKANALFNLHREALKRRRIDELWKHRAATEPAALLDVILSEQMMDEMRREIKRRTGITTTIEAIEEVIRTEIVDPKLMAKLYKS
ncbi:type I restriction enzyme HsdR N-terminal domain-containing protein [Arthrobacter sp. 35W]|uniref:type I restriction enzyme HsdR N-terminal domain-containing protein n=1 Tax=Arthrobacter sp. 35W TaxID=1132441 RepID=UPI00040DCF98|nr:type I restriction enzyme HsdR N-terminal domain-containing protein [Arthrobacter sp. 35W]